MHIIGQGSLAIKSLAVGHTLPSSLPHSDHLWGMKYLNNGLFWVEYDQFTMVTICLTCVVSRIFVWLVNWPLLITHIVHNIHSLSTWVKNCLDCQIRRELFRTTPQNGAHPATFQFSTLIILSYKILLLLLTLQLWVGLGLFDNSIPHLSILNLHPPASNFHPP